GFNESFSADGVEPPRNRAVFDEDASAGARQAPPGMRGEGRECVPYVRRAANNF
ncbi:hypothetical protein BO71DRAFT_331696, partial [Aspergillus ellipticus CBS 707.79]